MSADPEQRWEVVRVVELSASRRRLEFLLADGTKRYTVIDSELDTPERRARIAQALEAEDVRVKTPRGPQPAPGRGPWPWFSS